MSVGRAGVPRAKRWSHTAGATKNKKRHFRRTARRAVPTFNTPTHSTSTAVASRQSRERLLLFISGLTLWPCLANGSHIIVVLVPTKKRAKRCDMRIFVLFLTTLGVAQAPLRAQLPTITKQPASRALWAGGNVTFAVGISGDGPFSY